MPKEYIYRNNKQLFEDGSLNRICIYCGRKGGTCEHVPPRSFYRGTRSSDDNTVNACFDCNNKFSKDEDYVSHGIIWMVSKIMGLPLSRKTQRFIKLHGVSIFANLPTCTSDIKFLNNNKRFARIFTKIAKGHLYHERQILMIGQDALVEFDVATDNWDKFSKPLVSHDINLQDNLIVALTDETGENYIVPVRKETFEIKGAYIFKIVETSNEIVVEIMLHNFVLVSITFSR